MKCTSDMHKLYTIYNLVVSIYSIHFRFTCCCIFVSRLQGLEQRASTISKTFDCKGFFAGTFNAFKLSSFRTNTARLNRLGNIGPILVFVVRSSTAISFGFFLRFSIAENVIVS